MFSAALPCVPGECRLSELMCGVHRSPVPRSPPVCLCLFVTAGAGTERVPRGPGRGAAGASGEWRSQLSGEPTASRWVSAAQSLSLRPYSPYASTVMSKVIYIRHIYTSYIYG